MAKREGQQGSFRFPKGSPQAPVAAPVMERVKFGGAVSMRAGREPVKKLSKEERGPGFFTDPALKNPNIYEFTPDPEGPPLNYVWVAPGQFSTGPINSDVEDHAGLLVKRAKIVNPGKPSQGKHLHVDSSGSFTGRIIEVKDVEDRRFLGTFGWWREDQLSDEGGEKTVTEKPTF